MRVKVLSEFRDKYVPTRIYEPGMFAEFDDEARVADLVKRNLVEEASKAEVPEVKAGDSVEETPKEVKKKRK